MTVAVINEENEVHYAVVVIPALGRAGADLGVVVDRGVVHGLDHLERGREKEKSDAAES